MNRARWIQIISAVLLVFTVSHHAWTQTVSQQLQQIRLLERAGQTEAALSQYETLFQKNPESRLIFIYYKRLLLNEEKLEEALHLCRSAVHIKPVYEKDLALGQVYYGMGKTDQAHEIWDQLFERHGNSQAYIHSAANVLIEARLLEQALTLYERAEARMDKGPVFAWNRASIYQTLQQFGRASEAWFAYLNQRPKQIKMVLSQIERLPQTRTVYAEVLPVIKKAAQQHPENQQFAQLLYRFYLKHQDYAAAFSWVEKQEKALNAHESGRHYFSFGQIAFAAEAYSWAEKSLSSLITQNSGYKAEFGRHLLAKSRVKQKKWLEADKDYKSLVLDFPNSPHQARYQFEKIDVTAHLQGSKDTLCVHLNQLLKNRKLKPGLREEAESRLISLYLSSNQLNRADSLTTVQLGRYGLKDSRWPALWILKARIQFFREEITTAESLLDTLKSREIMSLHAGHEAVNDGLRLYWNIKSLSEAEDGKAYARAERLLFQQQTEAALTLVDSLLMTCQNQKMQGQLWFLKGLALEEKGALFQSAAAFDSVAAGNSNHRLSDEALKKEGDLYTKAGMRDEAAACYEKLLEDYPQSLYAGAAREVLKQWEDF